MGIKPIYDEKKRRNVYLLDVWDVNGKRRRELFPTRKLAEDVELTIKIAKKQKRHGITPPLPAPTLAELAARRLKAITNRNEKVRATRVLTTFLSLLLKSTRSTKSRKPICKSSSSGECRRNVKCAWYVSCGL